MKGVNKCFGLLLVLSIMVGLSLSVFSADTNALRHEYIGIPYLEPYVPSPSKACYVLQDGSYLAPSSGYNCGVTLGNFTDNFSLEFEGDSFDSSYSDLQLKGSSSFIGINNDLSYHDIRAIFIKGSSSSSNDRVSVTPYNQYYDTRLWDSSSLSVSNLNTQRRPVDFNLNSASGLMRCEPFGGYSGGSLNWANGAICPFTWSLPDYISSQVLPYWYTSDGFYLHSKAISPETGLSYSNTFSFKDLFNNSIPTFSRLTLPLWDYDSLYFANPDNLYSGRHLEFSGAFEFDGSFEWHDNIDTNGSYFRVNYFGVSDESQNNLDLKTYSGSFDCTANLITLSNLTRLEYTCPFDLPATFNYIGFTLDISGNGNYVWKTDSDWRFAYSFLTTDNDDTPGDKFNSQLTGGGYIAGDAVNNIPNYGNNAWVIDSFSVDELMSNFGDYISNLFVFNLINPFDFVFSSFSDPSSCAQIPTLANMIHLENPEVCPWFDSTTRSITTPVVTIVSSMLLFGFIVRWIRSSSSDFSPNVEGGDL